MMKRWLIYFFKDSDCVGTENVKSYKQEDVEEMEEGEEFNFKSQRNITIL